MYKLRIKGDKEPLSILDIAEVTDKTPKEVEDIVSSNVGNTISIGFITDIVVSKEKVNKLKPSKSKKERIIKKATTIKLKNKAKVGGKKLQISVVSRIPRSEYAKCRRFYNGVESTVEEIAKDLGCNASHLKNKLTGISQALIFNKEYFMIPDITGINRVNLVTDGKTMYENVTIKQISQNYDISNAYIRNVFSVKGKKAFVVKNILVSKLPLDKALDYIQHYGQNNERYYFGTLKIILKDMKIKKSYSIVQVSLKKYGMYKEGNKIIVRNWNTERRDK